MTPDRDADEFRQYAQRCADGLAGMGYSDAQARAVIDVAMEHREGFREGCLMNLACRGVTAATVADFDRHFGAVLFVLLTFQDAQMTRTR